MADSARGKRRIPWAVPGAMPARVTPALGEMPAVTIEERLKRILGRTFGVDETGVTDDTDLVVDLEFDSMDLIEFAIVCDEEFGIEIPEDEAVETWSRFRDWREYIERRITEEGIG